MVVVEHPRVPVGLFLRGGLLPAALRSCFQHLAVKVVLERLKSDKERS